MYYYDLDELTIEKAKVIKHLKGYRGASDVVINLNNRVLIARIGVDVFKTKKALINQLHDDIIYTKERLEKLNHIIDHLTK